ncbi:MAG: DUF1858 domain-containing protein [Candidatus Delongbacteria bacterium]|nr:DUF1858 domain-containing protein [Candidatus Delongbacteria bacterium]MBN2834334.1 DUF1858 domain-containing protein [Candidatus Delongbacteria bacterium]
MKKGDLIKKEDRITEVFEVYPHIIQVYLSKGMHCVGCEIQDFETVGESCENHEVGDPDEFVDYLNSVKDSQMETSEDE